MINQNTKEIFDHKKNFLMVFLNNAPFDGWTEKNFNLTVVKSGLGDGYSSLLFKNSLDDLTVFFIDNILVDIEQKILIDDHFKQLKVHQKIALLVDSFFQNLNEFREACFNLFKFFLLPQNFLLKEKIFWLVSDHFWIICNDQSIDFNYYSKRIILDKILELSFVYWISDNSPHSLKTKEFFSAQVANAGKIGAFKKSFKNFWEILVK